MKCCAECIYWNNDTGFCSIEMIIKSAKELCDFFKKDDDKND